MCSGQYGYNFWNNTLPQTITCSSSMNSLISKPQSAQSNTFSYSPYKALPYSLPLPRQILQLYTWSYLYLAVSTHWYITSVIVQSFRVDLATWSCMCFFDFKFALFFPAYPKLVWIILKCCYLSDYLLLRYCQTGWPDLHEKGNFGMALSSSGWV